VKNNDKGQFADNLKLKSIAFGHPVCKKRKNEEKAPLGYDMKIEDRKCPPLTLSAHFRFRL
jgi:hypothetical protein